MPSDATRRKVRSEHELPREAVSILIEEAVFDAREAIGDGLLEYLNSRLAIDADATFLPSDLSDGLLVAVLKLIGPQGKYAMEKGRFWQLLERYDPYVSPTLDETLQARLTREIETTLAVAENESFEDGYNSALSLELRRLVLKYGGAALGIIADLISRPGVSSSVAAEALRGLGSMRNPETHEARLQILQRGLTSASHITRDGAVTALADISDPRAIPGLEAAAASESRPLLKANMNALLDDLRELS